MRIQAPTGLNRVLFQGKSMTSRPVHFGSATSDAFEQVFNDVTEIRDDEFNASDAFNAGNKMWELIQQLLATEPDTLRHFLQGHASTLDAEGRRTVKAVMADALLRAFLPPESK